MSRGFVKEDDQEEAPVIPPRAALPAGAVNYVTPVGHAQLIKEREKKLAELKSLKIEDEKEKRYRTNFLTGSLNLLNERIASARIIDPAAQPEDEVRFGATVTFEFLNSGKEGNRQKFQIVGVDEANVREQKIAFTAPIAQVLTGKREGEIFEFQLGNEKKMIKILNIQYQ